jgi:D-methionine transport system ATP-binding protein
MSKLSTIYNDPPPIPLIRLDRVSCSFPQGAGPALPAVREVSLDILRGEIFGLAGRSGAGKSTLLRLINLLERPDSGRVQVDSDDLTSLGKEALRKARSNIGMIFQQFNLLKNATVFDNVAFPLRIHGGHDRAAIEARVTECLALVELEDKAGSYPTRLSGGQQQRVAIARALASKPAVLLCDEPTSALDAETTRALLRTLQDINRRLGVTIVIVSHELDALAAICHRVAVLEDGGIAEQFRVQDQSVPRQTALGRELTALAGAALVPNGAPAGVSARELQHA